MSSEQAGSESAGSGGGRGERRRQRIHVSIQVRVLVYLIIFLVMTVLVVVDSVAIGGGSVLPVLGCALGGFVVGVLASRMFSLTWNAESGKVVGRLDALGIGILICYVAFSLLRGQLADVWLDAGLVGVGSLALLAGAMAGQIVGTRRGVVRVLRMAAGRSE